MKKLLLGILTAAAIWFAVTRLYMNLSPFGSVESLGISVAVAAVALAIIAAVGKAIGKAIPPFFYIVTVIVTTTAYLLLSVSPSSKPLRIIIDCDKHEVRGTKMFNKGERVRFRFRHKGNKIKVSVNFDGPPNPTPLWDMNHMRVYNISGEAPGISDEYRVHGSNRQFNFKYQCEPDTNPSNGMIQIPRQYSLFPPDDDEDDEEDGN